MNWLLQMTVPVLAGFVLDLLLGDPAWLYHPVRLIGLLIEKGEKIIRKCLPKTRGGERLGGVVLVIFVVSISALVPLGILLAAYRFFVPLGLLIESFFCYQILAVKSLKVESDRVCRALKEEGLISGRKAVSMIVGRDTEGLSEEGVTKAAVETVAENTSDGVIAPLFYMVIGGAVLGFAYKAVNTMDSMIGYKNDKYRYFGTAAARLDDAAELSSLPACGASDDRSLLPFGDGRARGIPDLLPGPEESQKPQCGADGVCHGRRPGSGACGKCLVFWETL